MKKITTLFEIVVIFFVGCASTGNIQSNNSLEKQVMSASYFIGNGGKDISLAILVPEGKGLPDNQSYLPTLVQGVLVGDMSKYSAISVLDRITLDKVLRETMDPTYEDDDTIVSLGHVKQVEYILTGNITKTISGYVLQLQISDTTPAAITKASYSGTCTVAEFDNFIGIKRASYELLSQMGIQLTDSAKRELSIASSPRSIKAQIALSEGLIAQHAGDNFSALHSYFEARNFDYNINEVDTLISYSAQNTSNASSSGSTLRDQVISSIQQQREAIQLEKSRKENIKNILGKASDFYKDHQPFKITVDENFTLGSINVQKESVDITISIALSPLEEEFKIISQLANQAKKYGFSNWPFTYNRKRNADDIFLHTFMDICTWGLAEIYFVVDGYYYKPDTVRNYINGIWKMRYNYDYNYGKSSGIPVKHLSIMTFNIVADILNETGKKLARLSIPVEVTIFDSYNCSTSGGKNTFTIQVDDLTDNLIVKIISVNGHSLNSGYIGIVDPIKTISGR
ncbi:MAG: hypothetical protein LBH32_13270 [Dysgonamonadaceae bacterium]|nr:hypothetical protein [Dysgonamonadaceae bacterium]